MCILWLIKVGQNSEWWLHLLSFFSTMWLVASLNDKWKVSAPYYSTKVRTTQVGMLLWVFHQDRIQTSTRIQTYQTLDALNATTQPSGLNRRQMHTAKVWDSQASSSLRTDTRSCVVCLCSSASITHWLSLDISAAAGSGQIFKLRSGSVPPARVCTAALLIDTGPERMCQCHKPAVNKRIKKKIKHNSSRIKAAEKLWNWLELHWHEDSCD